MPAAGRGGLVCAHCGFASAHDRAFYCPKCGMRLLRGCDRRGPERPNAAPTTTCAAHAVIDGGHPRDQRSRTRGARLRPAGPMRKLFRADRALQGLRLGQEGPGPPPRRRQARAGGEGRGRRVQRHGRATLRRASGQAPRPGKPGLEQGRRKERSRADRTRGATDEVGDLAGRATEVPARRPTGSRWPRRPGSSPPPTCTSSRRTIGAWARRESSRASGSADVAMSSVARSAALITAPRTVRADQLQPGLFEDWTG